MPTSRRGFLKLMGIGGAGIAAASMIGPSAAKAVAKPILAPLFGSDEVPAPKGLIITGQPGLGQHHIVFARRVFDRLTEEERQKLGTEYAARTQVRASGIGSALFNSIQAPGDYQIVGKVRSAIPGKKQTQAIALPSWDAGRRQRLWVNEWEAPLEFCIQPPGMPDAIGDTDPHALYYQAALKMRAQFQQHTIARLTELNEWQRKEVNLVTVVHQPIYARPLGMMSGSRDPFNKAGFEVACEFQTLLYRSHYRTPDLTDFTEYSATGEYPIDPPNSIEMGILMKLDRDVLSSGILTATGKTRRGFFQSWRS